MRLCPCCRMIVLLILGVGAVDGASGLKPAKAYPSTPADFGIIFQEVTFATSDSLQLKGWFIPAQDTAGIATDIIGRCLQVPRELRRPPRRYPEATNTPGPAIVLCDGDAGNMAYQIFYAYHLFTRGFHVFMFDWRGFGESDEWAIDENLLCYPEFLLDYNAAIDYLRSRPEVDATRIGLLGFSTGAYLSFAMMAQREDIGAYVGRALMTSFADLVRILQEIDPERGFRAPEGYPRELEPVNAAASVATPVLLVVGEKDDRTPPWMSRKVMDLVKGPRELWVVPGATHGGRTGPDLANYPEFFERVLGFFKKHLSAER